MRGVRERYRGSARLVCVIVVNQPELTARGAVTRVSSRIEIPSLGSHELWFEAEGPAAAFLSVRSDAFAAAVAPLANTLGEGLGVRGTSSPRLAWGLRELQRVHAIWWPRSTGPIEIDWERLAPAGPEDCGSGVAAGFSGGVDSLFTTWRHLPRVERIPGFALNHIVMIDGFDYDSDQRDPGRFEALRSIYGPLAESEGLSLVIMRTNMQAFQLATAKARVNWLTWIGALLASPALAMSRGLRRHYIAAAEGYAHFDRLGSHPLTDGWLSTEGMEILHDGADASRSDKLAALATWPATFDRLRVCRTPDWSGFDVQRKTISNCGRCEKCTRTMIALHLNGTLDRYRTFSRPLSWPSIAAARHDHSLFYARESLRLLLSGRELGLAGAAAISLGLSIGRMAVRRVLRLLRGRRRTSAAAGRAKNAL